MEGKVTFQAEMRRGRMIIVWNANLDPDAVVLEQSRMRAAVLRGWRLRQRRRCRFRLGGLDRRDRVGRGALGSASDRSGRRRCDGGADEGWQGLGHRQRKV